jgi:phosphatidylserine/phosphatidylglycerophosphate/cardiolipin synthase-like enzyme
MTDKIQVTLLTAHNAKDSADLKKTQAKKIAQLFSDFVSQAHQSIHIAIYDFRLEEPEAQIVIDALNEAAESRIDVRVAYFQPNKKHISPSEFALYGSDPAPGPDEEFFWRFHKDIPFKAIAGIEELPPGVPAMPIEGGSHLMHSKYIIRDGLSSSAAVWTGSANFTTDAWSIQDNNIVILKSQDIAGNYATDFAELWETGRIAGTGKNDHGETKIDDVDTDVDFAPGDGIAMDANIASQISNATKEIMLASMVISSGTVLGAIIDALRHGVKVSGVYDGPQMSHIIKEWERGAAGQAKIAQWDAIKDYLVAKHSTPYKETGPHDFMHNKILVVDQQIVVTGSYNFSKNATRNAENIITLYDEAIARQYEQYIEELISKYK